MSDTPEKCGSCDGSGAVDSGGVTPWGQGINMPCPECQSKTPDTDQFIEYAVRTDWNWRTFARRLERQRNEWMDRTADALAQVGNLTEQRDAYAETLRALRVECYDFIDQRHPELAEEES